MNEYQNEYQMEAITTTIRKIRVPAENLEHARQVILDKLASFSLPECETEIIHSAEVAVRRDAFAQNVLNDPDFLNFMRHMKFLHLEQPQPIVPLCHDLYDFIIDAILKYMEFKKSGLSLAGRSICLDRVATICNESNYVLPLHSPSQSNR